MAKNVTGYFTPYATQAIAQSTSLRTVHFPTWTTDKPLWQIIGWSSGRKQALQCRCRAVTVTEHRSNNACAQAMSAGAAHSYRDFLGGSEPKICYGSNTNTVKLGSELYG